MITFSVRILTERGIGAFRNYLHNLSAGAKDSPPKEILYSPLYSDAFAEDIPIEPRPFSTSFDVVDYLSDILTNAGDYEVADNIGIWSWLSLFYFDQVCPLDQHGMRKPGREYRHIPDLGFRHRHRHLLAGPYSVFIKYGAEARLLLCSPPYRENQFLHELASRQNLIVNPAILEAATILYLDETKNRPKSGATVKGKPGTIYRFIDLMQQLDVTYDLYSMKTDQLLSILPPEFDHWKLPLPFLR